jgi:hypothetical protein
MDLDYTALVVRFIGGRFWDLSDRSKKLVKGRVAVSVR